ncbi:tail fiber assembly protein [Salmonella enterica]|nr:tail fiber assembly protein [Salmonella enterica]EKJ6082554.1 tail fiber assembly protein [Salmonella enterica]
MELKNVTIYSPEEKPFGDGFLYFRSEDGRDFYESFNLFTKKYKLCTEPDTGIIRSMHEDISRLYPAGFTVVEVDELPDGVDIYGGWQYRNGIVTTTPDYYANKAEAERQKRLSEAEDIIADWKTELGLGIISEEDKARLTQWMPYIRALKALNFDTITDESSLNAINWPERPDAAA